MSTYCLFSGFDNDRGFPEELAQSLETIITNRGTLIYIASSPKDFETTDYYKDITVGWFAKIGIEFERVVVIDDRKSQAESKSLIREASVILLAGGITLNQMEFLKRSDLVSELQRYEGVVMGISAGAINMAVDSFYSADEDHSLTQFYDGLGLVGISVEPHFLPDDVKRLELEILPYSNEADIYCLCDDSAIIVKDGERCYLGDVYLASKGVLSKIN